MKSEELSKQLRIGNYLFDREDNICQVQELGTGTLYAPVIGKNLTKLPNKPIELTEEWLLKFGFNKNYKQGYIGIDVGNNDFVLTYPGIMGEFQKSFAFEFRTGGWPKLKELQYVHQLQNLYYSLCGEELELKNK